MSKLIRILFFIVLVGGVAFIFGCGSKDEDVVTQDVPAELAPDEEPAVEEDPVIDEEVDYVSFFDFERLLPDSPMLMYYSGGAEAVKRLARDTAVSKIWLDEGMMDAMAPIYHGMVDMLGEMPMQAQPGVNLAVPIIEALATSQWCIAVESLDVELGKIINEPEPPAPAELEGIRAAWLIHAPEDSAAAEAADNIESLLRLAVPRNQRQTEGAATRLEGLPVVVEFGRTGDIFTLAVGEGLGVKILQEQPEGPGEVFTQKRKKVAGDSEPLAFCYIDMLQFQEFYHKAFMQQEYMEEWADKFELTQGAVDSVCWALTADGAGFKDVAYTTVDDSELIQLYRELTPEQLQIVPEDALLFGASAFDYNQLLNMLDVDNDNETDGFQAEFEQEFGFSFEDVVRALGEKCVMYVPNFIQKRQYPDIVLNVEISDIDDFKGYLETVNAKIEESLQDNDDVDIKEGEYDDTGFSYLTFEDTEIEFSPAWTATDSHFIFSATSDGLKSAMARLNEPIGKSILDNEGFKSSFERLERDEFNSIYFVDAAFKSYLIDAFYGLLTDNESVNEFITEGLDVDLQALPEAETVSEYMFNTINLAYQTEDGNMKSEGYGPLGGTTTHMIASMKGVMVASAAMPMIIMYQFMHAFEGMDEMDGMEFDWDDEDFDDSDFPPPVDADDADEDTPEPSEDISHILEMIGPVLVDADGSELDSSVLLDKDYIFLYFSAEWCPPCRQFTPSLVEFYGNYSERANLEIVFVSSDRSSSDKLSYMQDYNMDFLAVPHERVRESGLAEKFSVRGIPHLAALDSDGNIVMDTLQVPRDEMLVRLAEKYSK